MMTHNPAKKHLGEVRRVAVFGNSNQQQHVPDINTLLKSLNNLRISIYIEGSFAHFLSNNGGVIPRDATRVHSFPKDADLIISLGGDGTFLHAAQWCAHSNTPILGINTGHLGFLANCSVDDTQSLLNEMVSGKLTLEKRAILHISGDDIPENFWPFALNEIAISKEDTSSMISVRTTIDGDFLADYLGDGLVISTPTGSTAYNLSLGGPILQPTLGCIVLTPSAPHSLTLRPVVISGDSEIKCLTTSRAMNYRISADGRSFVAPCNSQISIRRARFTIVTLRRPDDNFAATLRNKLHWGSR